MAITIKVEEGEYALVIGQDESRMSVRIEGAEVDGDETGDLPVPAVLVAALAERLLRDPEFHDEMLEWYEENALDEDAEDGPAGQA